MKKFLIFLLLPTFLIAQQQMVEINPTLGKLVNKSSKGELEFIKERQKCEVLWEKVINQAELEKLSEIDKEIYNNCDETYENYWEILGIGCSWYCSGGQDTISASSTLKSLKRINYSAKNAHDLNYKTAWIEGIEGHGIGESLTYHFPPRNPRITKLLVVNGYVKSDKSWTENSRVKKLKMYLNGKPIAILNLNDTKQEQEFTFKPMGYSERDDWEELKKKPWWTMKFEIMEVYPGDKYDDTAITEIYFDGIDVH